MSILVLAKNEQLNIFFWYVCEVDMNRYKLHICALPPGNSHMLQSEIRH